jgi:hypothetical protein
VPSRERTWPHFFLRGLEHLQVGQKLKAQPIGILLEDWATRGMARHGRLFKRGFWEDNEDHLMEMEMLDARNSPAEAMDGDGVGGRRGERKAKPSQAMLA